MLAFASMVAIVLLVLLQLTRLGFLVRTTIPDRPRRRLFIASVSFLFTFVGVRLLVRLVVNDKGPFQWVMVRGHHVHHLVWGILILLLVGYGWLLDLGRSHSPLSIFLSRLMSIGYGVGAAVGGMVNETDSTRPHWLFYFNVDDIDAAHSRITAYGGEVRMDPHQVPTGQWIVLASDPQGARFALVGPRR